MDLKYYFWATYRRKLLDKLQKKHLLFYKGTVLDIGGRDRGNFKKPKGKVEKWIFADVEEKHNPDLVLDVADMQNVEDDSVNVVNAIELFEHVRDIENGLKECYRVLKKDGHLILSVPFLYPVHGDPNDYQRWTLDKWKLSLAGAGLMIQEAKVMGRFFTILGDMKKSFIRTLPFGIRHLCYLTYPLMDILIMLDEKNFVKKNEVLKKYHGGYFIVAKKE